MRAGLAKIDAVHKYNGFVRLHNALVRIGRLKRDRKRGA